MLPYGSGVAKMLTNMELAPWAGLKGYSDSAVNKGIQEFANLNLRGTSGQDVKRALTRQVERRVGTHNDFTVNSSFYDFSRNYTSTLLRLQLGVGGLSGVKNVTTQAVQFLNTFAFTDIMTHALRAMKKAKG